MVEALCFDPHTPTNVECMKHARWPKYVIQVALGMQERSEQAADVISQSAQSAASSAKDAIDEKMLSDDDKQKREDAKKKPRGPFGIFGRG